MVGAVNPIMSHPILMTYSFTARKSKVNALIILVHFLSLSSSYILLRLCFETILYHPIITWRPTPTPLSLFTNQFKLESSFSANTSQSPFVFPYCKKLLVGPKKFSFDTKRHHPFDGKMWNVLRQFFYTHRLRACHSIPMLWKVLM